MAFIKTIPTEDASDMLAEIYAGEMKEQGYIANGTMTLSLRPEVFIAWENLLKTIRSKMRLRRYELVTIATAGALHCTYCCSHTMNVTARKRSMRLLESALRHW